MPIIVSALCSILIWIFVDHKKKSLIRTFLTNVLLTVFMYAYYLGYSASVLKAAFFSISPNAVYCSAMSVMTAGLMCVVKFFKLHQKTADQDGRVDYHI